jgi:uncharacterized protein (TIGR02145 family)
MITETRFPITTCRKGLYLRWYYNGWHYWNFLFGTIAQLTAGEKYRTTGMRTVELSSGVVSLAQIAAIRSILNSRECYMYTDGGWAECRVQSGNVVVQRNRIDAYELQCKLMIGSRKVSDTGYSVGETIDVYVPCPIVIGTQTWDCRNYTVRVNGSVAFNNDESNASIYGRLYTWSQINASGFCPSGWHVPTFAEWQTLHTFLSPDEGDQLKESGTDHWDAGNGGYDSYGFGERGNGWYNDGIFDLLKHSSTLWSSTFGAVGYVHRCDHDSSDAQFATWWPAAYPNLYAGVRLIKN